MISKREARLIHARALATLARVNKNHPSPSSNVDGTCVWVGDFNQDNSPSAIARRIIHGVASTEAVCSDNSVMLARGAALAAPIPLLVEHDWHNGSIGKVVFLRRTGSQLYCRAVVDDDQAWQKIERYELRGLSCGFRRGQYQIKVKASDVIKVFDKYEIDEISICRRPANPDCYFKVFSVGIDKKRARLIHARARKLLDRLNDEEKGSAARKEWDRTHAPSALPHRKSVDSRTVKNSLSAEELADFWAWYNKSNQATSNVGEHAAYQSRNFGDEHD